MEGSVDGWSQEQMKQYIDDNNICCPSCGAHDFTDIRQFNLMFKTFQGVTEDAKSTVYLRPETAQGISLTLRMYRELPGRRCHSASARSASPSATRFARKLYIPYQGV